MLKKLSLVGSMGVLAMACGGYAATTIPSPADEIANVAAKPAESGPTRITLKKINGKAAGTLTIALAPGASAQFIVAVKGAQNLFITPASNGLAFRVVKGTDGQFTKGDDGVYMVETKGNNAQKSEVVFEVKNAAAKEIKTSIKVEVEDFGD